MLQSQGVWTGGFVVVVVVCLLWCRYRFIYIEVFGSVRIDAGVKVFGNKMNCEQNETKRDEKQNSRKETSEGWTGKGGKEEYS